MRNSGRTSIMLHRAVAAALDGQNVLVVAGTQAQAHSMFKRVAEMQTPVKSSEVRLVLDYGVGRMHFVADAADHMPETGFSGTLYVDHYVYERRGL